MQKVQLFRLIIEYQNLKQTISTTLLKHMQIMTLQLMKIITFKRSQVFQLEKIKVSIQVHLMKTFLLTLGPMQISVLLLVMHLNKLQVLGNMQEEMFLISQGYYMILMKNTTSLSLEEQMDLHHLVQTISLDFSLLLLQVG